MSENKLKNKLSNIKIDLDEIHSNIEDNQHIRGKIEQITGESLKEDKLSNVSQTEINNFLDGIAKKQKNSISLKPDSNESKQPNTSNSMFKIEMNSDMFKSYLIHCLKTDDVFVKNLAFYIKKALIKKDNNEW